MKKEITVDKDLIAYCGLYCGACPQYLKGKCPGCRENEKLSWCKIRNCNREEGTHNCAECRKMAFADCKLNHNLISKFFGFVFNSDRDACVARIKDIGPEAYAAERAAEKRMAIKRRS